MCNLKRFFSLLAFASGALVLLFTAPKNSTLEECPQKIYKKEGFTEEKAKSCFAKGVEAAQKKE